MEGGMGDEAPHGFAYVNMWLPKKFMAKTANAVS